MNRHLRTIVCLLIITEHRLPARRSTSARHNPVALLSKVILDVLKKESGKNWEKATRGQTLASGDMVRTGRRCSGHHQVQGQQSCPPP